jgi:DNA-binding transcriptional LysR family regulator
MAMRQPNSARAPKPIVTLSNVLEVDQYDTALIMIAAGCGVSIVPAAARMVAAPGVAYRPLAEAITCPIVLCHLDRDTSPELRTLYSVLAQFLYERGHAVPAELQRGMLRFETARA